MRRHLARTVGNRDSARRGPQLRTASALAKLERLTRARDSDSWVPYLPTQGGSRDEVAADPPRLDNVTSPPLDILALAPRSYNALISVAEGDLAQVPELDFMRGRVVIFVGDRCARPYLMPFFALAS